MKDLSRRDAIKVGAKIVVAGSLVACGDQNDVAEVAGEGESMTGTGHRMFDTGTVPVEASGWTKPSGVELPYPALETDVQTDVLVVGAGLAGASLSLHLSERGVDTVLLESRQPGWGASGRNAGHVLPLLKNFEVFDGFSDQGKQFLDLFREHHSIPFDIAEKYGIRCDASRSGYLNAIKSPSSLKKFSVTAASSAERLGQNIRTLGPDEMRAMTGSEYYPHGVFYESGGRINPYLFTCGMVRAAHKNGAQVYGESEAVSVLPEQNRWIVKVKNGASVRCDKLVFCTNAYSGSVVPELAQSCYPMTAYALSTEPLSTDLSELMMPSRATLAQAPVDMNPFVIDEHNRIITASIPSRSRPSDANWHFQHHLDWIHRTWPEAKDVDIKLESYWTGRVAMRDQEFPGMYRLASGVYGLMHFNAWGNVMAPLMGMALAKSIAQDRPDTLPFPMVSPSHVANPGKQEFIIRNLMIPAARIAQDFGII